MLRSKLCSSSQGGILFSCCLANEDQSEPKIDRRSIGPPMDFRHLVHMGSSGCSSCVTSSLMSGNGLVDSPLTRGSITPHLKLIDLSEALAAHNASAAAALHPTNQKSAPGAGMLAASEPNSCVSDPAIADVGRCRKSTASRYLISGPLPPPPPPPPSALIA